MSEADVMTKVVGILSPYAKNSDALAHVGLGTHILDDLKVNSARLVDVVLAFEDEFGIEIADDDVDGVNTVGDAVHLIMRSQIARSQTSSGSGADDIGGRE